MVGFEKSFSCFKQLLKLMNIPVLLEDLIKDFRQDRVANLAEIEQTDQIVGKVKRSITYRFLLKSISLFLELILWIAMLACFLIIILTEKFYPFSILSHLKLNDSLSGVFQKDLNVLIWAIRGVFFVLGFTFLWVARLLMKARKRGKLMNNLSKDLKSLMEQLLRRRSAIQALTMKYPVDLAEENDSVSPPALNSSSEEGLQNSDNHDDILL